jgi:hypothetical protein
VLIGGIEQWTCQQDENQCNRDLQASLLLPKSAGL